jgi:hypothetical protein
MSDQKRRVTGFWVGVAFGLPYLYISQFINVWMLPGIPLFDLPIGRAATVILGTLSMGILGLIVAWEEESFWGILGGALFGVVVSYFQAYINSGESQALSSLILFVYTFLPRLLLYIPAGLFLRWVLNQQEYIVARSPDSLRRRVTVWLAILVVAVIGGRLSLYVPEVRQALKDADALVLEGLSSVGNGADLPKPLIPVDGFSTYAKGTYTLEWNSDVDSLPVTRPRVSFGVIESLIIFRFENGYQFGCVYTPPSYTANCINITRVR